MLYAFSHCASCGVELSSLAADPRCQACGLALVNGMQAATEPQPQTWVSGLVVERDARYLVLRALLALEPEELNPYMADVAVQAAMKRVVKRLEQAI